MEWNGLARFSWERTKGCLELETGLAVDRLGSTLSRMALFKVRTSVGCSLENWQVPNVR